MDNPIVAKFLNEAVRPQNERGRRVFVNWSDEVDWYNTHVAPLLSGVSDATVIEDGRTDVPSLTVGQLKRWIEVAKFLALFTSHRGNVDQNQLQNAFNDFVNANINVRETMILFTVRDDRFEVR